MSPRPILRVSTRRKYLQFFLCLKDRETSSAQTSHAPSTTTGESFASAAYLRPRSRRGAPPLPARRDAGAVRLFAVRRVVQLRAQDIRVRLKPEGDQILLGARGLDLLRVRPIAGGALRPGCVYRPGLIRMLRRPRGAPLAVGDHHARALAERT